MNWSKKCVGRALNVGCYCRRFSQKPIAVKKQLVEKDDPSLIRNIGILAHIDAGKTTTTERMLFYSGTIGSMGEVHRGNTVTDFMEQERERGITITTASVTFQWGKHVINLLDTPGHIDFTMEVEQTLNVMDGAVVILDGSAGVEAQTVTVWRQADRHNIPRIVYVNKMDKPKAGFFRSVNSLREQLQATPVVLHLPIINNYKLEGIVDLITLEKCEWNTRNFGSSYSQKVLTSEDGKLWEVAMNARIKLTETLTDLDDKMAEMIIADEKKLETVSSESLRESIRKVTLERKGIPVLCGSSYKNIGVQLLMDAVVYYLPSPLCNEAKKIMECFKNALCAKAFKVRHDEEKGPVTFFRIYSGNLTKGQRVYNVSKKKSEQCGKLYVAHADDYEEVPCMGAGQIATVAGLKLTTSGDVITSSESDLQSIQKAVNESCSLFTLRAVIPEPVFFCSIEAASQTEQQKLDRALTELQREDPSLRVSVNNETGQTILGGMGELHLDIIKQRITTEYKVEAYLGPLLVAYKETLLAPIKGSHTVKHKIGNGTHSVSITLSVLQSKGRESGKLLLDKSKDSAENISAIFHKHLLAVKNGIDIALQSGPKVMCPVVGVDVMLHWLEVGRGTSESVISSATSQCIKKLLKEGGTKLLEPLMMVEIVCGDKLVETIVNDLERRRAKLESVDARGSDTVIRTMVPLSELLGYSTEFRILTSGKAAFSMEFHSYQEMKPEDEPKAVKSITGIEY